MVQQRRKQIAEQQKLHRAQLLVQQQQHPTYYNQDTNAFPHLCGNSNEVPNNTLPESTFSPRQTTNLRSYASVAAAKIFEWKRKTLNN